MAIVTEAPPETGGWCSRLALVGLDGLEVGFGIVGVGVVSNQRRHPLLWRVAVTLGHHTLLFVGGDDDDSYWELIMVDSVSVG